MRFETSQSTPPDLNRRLQLRMLSFVVLFAVVMFLVNVLLMDPPKKPNDVGSRSAIPHRNSEFEAPIERSREWLDEQAAKGEEWAEDAAVRDRAAARRSTRFDKRALAPVKDNTLGIRRDEADAYFRLLEHVKHVSPTDLARAAATDVQYINLMTEPDRFRGEPITIQGDLWRLYEFEAGPNDRGLATLYEAWIFTGDSSNHPYRVVSTSLPLTLTPGENVRTPVRVTGYFFKREGYPSQGGMHVAPTLLAPTVTPYRPANAIPLTDANAPYLTGIATAIGLALLVTLLACTLGDQRVKRTARRRMLSEPTPTFAGLNVEPLVTIEESLRQFAEQERQADLRDEIAATGRDAGSVATSVLYRRDPHASVPAAVPSATLSDDELHSRQVSQANVLQSWTSRHQATENADAESGVSEAQLNREQRETDRVLNRLDPAATNAADRTDAESADTDGSVFTLGTSTAPTDDERAAQAQLERDRLIREQEHRDRLREQRSELEQEQRDRLERERAAKAHADWEASRADAERERSRLESERRLRDEQVRDESPPVRLTFDRAARAEPAVGEAGNVEEDLDTTGSADSTGESNRPARPPGWIRRNDQRARHRRDGR